MSAVKQRAVLAFVAVLAVLGLGWAFLVTPQRSQAAELRAAAAEQEQANERAVMQLAVLQAQARDLPEQRARLADIARKIPATPALPELVRALRDAAADSGVEFLSLVPGAPAPADGGTGDAAAPAGLQAVPVTINVVGGYYDVEQYVSALETLPRALRVTRLDLAPGQNPLAAAGPADQAAARAALPKSTLSATVVGQVFVSPAPAATAVRSGSASAGAAPSSPASSTPAGAPAADNAA